MVYKKPVATSKIDGSTLLLLFFSFFKKLQARKVSANFQVISKKQPYLKTRLGEMRFDNLAFDFLHSLNLVNLIKITSIICLYH